MLPRAYITCNCAEIFICWRHWPRQYIEIVQLWLKVGVHDNCAILDISRRHLTGHSSKHLRNFWLFSCKTALALRKLFCRSWFFFQIAPKSVFYHSQVKAFGWFGFMEAQIWAITFVLNVLNYTNFLVIIMSPLLPAIETITH